MDTLVYQGHSFTTLGVYQVCEECVEDDLQVTELNNLFSVSLVFTDKQSINCPDHRDKLENITFNVHPATPPSPR